MVELCLENINRKSPYKLEYRGNGFYTFRTDHGVSYAVKFKEDFVLSTENSYEFVLTNTNDKNSPLDKKLRDTIVSIILEFFRVNNRTMLYVCSVQDGKQRARNRLFKAWFESEQAKGDFVFSHYELLDEDGVLNYAAVITRYDNPEFVEVMADLRDVILSLKQKK